MCNVLVPVPVHVRCEQEASGRYLLRIPDVRSFEKQLRQAEDALGVSERERIRLSYARFSCAARLVSVAFLAHCTCSALVM